MLLPCSGNPNFCLSSILSFILFGYIAVVLTGFATGSVPLVDTSKYVGFAGGFCIFSPGVYITGSLPCLLPVPSSPLEIPCTDSQNSCTPHLPYQHNASPA